MSGWGSGGGWGGNDGGGGNTTPSESTGGWQSSPSSTWGGSPPGDHRPSGGWDSGDSSVSGSAVSRPPLGWLLAAFGVVILSAVIWVVNDGTQLGVVGWFLAGPVAVGLWGTFLIQDNRRRVAAWYAPSGITVPLRVALLVVAFAVVALHAYHVADRLSRGGS